MPFGISSKQRHRALVIELCGLPGSGKTFLTQELSKILNEKDWSVLDFSRGTSPAGLTWRWAWDHLARQFWMLRHPLTTLALQRLVKATGQKDEHECKRFIEGWLKTIVRLQRTVTGYDIILMDQGFLQTLWAIGYQADPATWPQLRRSLLRLMPAPDAAILVTVTRQVAARRLKNRPGTISRVERDGPDSAAVMQHAHELTEELCNDLSIPRPGWSNTVLLPVNNDVDGPPTASLKTLVQRLEQRAESELPCATTFSPNDARAPSHPPSQTIGS